MFWVEGSRFKSSIYNYFIATYLLPKRYLQDLFKKISQVVAGELRRVRVQVLHFVNLSISCNLVIAHTLFTEFIHIGGATTERSWRWRRKSGGPELLPMHYLQD